MKVNKRCDFIRKMIHEHPEMSARDILNAWNKTADSKTEPAMDMQQIYQIRHNNQKHKTVTTLKVATKKPKKRAKFVDKSSTKPMVSPVLADLRKMETKLDDMITQAKDLKDNELSEALLQSRRLLGRSIIARS